MANLSNINGKFVVEQTTGYVGVGTTDPSYPIEVLNASAEIALNASGGSTYRLQSDSASNFIIRKEGVGDRLVINSAGNSTFAGTINSGAITSSASIIASGNSNSFGNTTTAALSATSGTFSASVTAAGNSNSFGTTTFAGRIDIDGSPVATGDTRAVLSIDENNSASAGRGGGLTFGRQGNVYGGIKTLQNTSSNDNATMYFQTIGGGTVSNRMVIDELGNVGIGTDSPDFKLSLNGGMRIENTSPSPNTGSGTEYGYNATTNEGFQITRTKGVGTSTYRPFIHRAEDIIFQTGTTSTTTRLTIDNSGNATFAGNVTIENSLPKITLKSTDNTAVTGDTVSSVEFYAGDTSSAGQAVNAKILSYATDNFGRLGLKFLTGGNGTPEDRLRIDSSGITTLTAEGYQLAIVDTSSSNKSEILTSNNAMGFFADRANAIANSSMIFSIDNSTKMTIDSLGDAEFEADIKVNANAIIGPNINNLNTFDYYLQTRQLLVAGYAGTGASNIYIHRDDQTIAGTDIIGDLNFSGQDGASNVGAQIRVIAASSWGTTAAPSDMTFSTCASASNTLVERMRIDSSGNVGIGTDDPQTKLHLYDNTATVGLSIQADNAGSSDINLGDEDDINIGRIKYDHSDNSMRFRTNNAERMRIDSSGTIISRIDESTAATFKHIKLGGGTGVNGNGQYIQFSSSSNAALGSRIEGTRVAAGAASDLKFYTTSGSSVVTERMRITSGGVIQNSTISNSVASAVKISNNAGGGNFIYGITIEDDSTNTGFILFSKANGDSVGSITRENSSTSYNTSSDYRLKEDLQDFEGLDMISKIPVYDFKWKTDESRSYGVMAHELQEVLPDAVSGEKDAEEMQGVDYSKIVPLLVKSIQELKADNDSLKARIETLENN